MIIFQKQRNLTFKINVEMKPGQRTDKTLSNLGVRWGEAEVFLLWGRWKVHSEEPVSTEERVHFRLGHQTYCLPRHTRLAQRL